MVFPHQVGIACLSPHSIVYYEVLSDISLAGCPTPNDPRAEQISTDPDQYPESSRVLLPEIRNPARMSFRRSLPMPPEAYGEEYFDDEAASRASPETVIEAITGIPATRQNLRSEGIPELVTEQIVAEVTRRILGRGRNDGPSREATWSQHSFQPPPGLNNLASSGSFQQEDFVPVLALPGNPAKSNVRLRERVMALAARYADPAEERLQERPPARPERPVEDPEWIQPSDIDWVVTEYCRPEVKFIWYESGEENAEPWKLAGWRGLGNTDIMKSHPVRCRTHYDPNLPINLIDRRILSDFEIRRYGGPLPGSYEAAEGRSQITIQVPWRRYEFFRARYYIEIDVRIRAGCTIPRVKFLVLEESQAQVIMGAPICQQLFHETRQQDQILVLRWG